MTITAHPSTKTLAILDLAVALLVVSSSAPLLADATPANIALFVMAVLIPTALLFRHIQSSKFRTRLFGQRILALSVMLALSAAWICVLSILQKIIIAGLLTAVLIPTGLLRWKAQAVDLRSLPAWQALFAVLSILALSVVWLFSLLMSAGWLMRLGTPKSVFTIIY